MNASVLDLRRSMKKVVAALNRNEIVTLTYRGKEKADIVPRSKMQGKINAREHEAFGLWRDREDFNDVAKTIRKLRKGRKFCIIPDLNISVFRNP